MQDALLNYVRETRRQGYAEDQIRSQLLSTGWSETDAQSALAATALQSPAPLRERALCLLFCVLAVLLAVAVNAHLFTP